jgi:glycosyltransferase involved in cell wall biosynthesis
MAARVLLFARRQEEETPLYRLSEDTPRRVAHVSIIHAPNDTRIFRKQCRSLAAAGHEVHLIAPGSLDAPPGGVKFHSLSETWSRPPLRRQWRLQRRAWPAAWRVRADVYHLHDPHLIPLGLALKLRGARVIYDSHEHYPNHARTKLAGRPLRSRLKSGLWSVLEVLARRSFDGFVCASEEISRRFPTALSVVVRNYPILGDHAHHAPVPYAQRPPNVIFAGSQRRILGLWEALDAMELLPPELGCRLTLIGRADPPRLHEEATRHPGWRHIDLLRQQPFERVARELGRARLGLAAYHPMPNHVSPAGSNKLYEYMAAGLPVIVSTIPAWRRLVEENGCGLAVDPLDARAIAGAIEHLVRNPREAEEMGVRGRIAIEARFNWRPEADELLRLYRSLGAERVPAPVQ